MVETTPITFWTPVYDPASCATNAIEDYFYLNGKQAKVISGEAINGGQLVELYYPPEQLCLLVIKVISYITVIIPLIILVCKIIFRITHRFYTTTAPCDRPPQVWTAPEKIMQSESKTKAGLGRGIGLNKTDVTRLIKKHFSAIKGKKQNSSITFLSGQNDHRIFALSSHPTLLFKMKIPKQTLGTSRDTVTSVQQHFNTILKAEILCKEYKLDDLLIPRAKFFTLRKNAADYAVIVEEKLSIGDKAKQEQLYQKHNARLDCAIQQLAFLILKTTYCGVTKEHIPIIERKGHPKIALINLGETGNGFAGIYGENNSQERGLINCINERHKQLVTSFVTNWQHSQIRAHARPHSHEC